MEGQYQNARLETATMHRVYEIFEVLPNGSPQRVSVVSGLDSAKARLHELANQTPNECFASDARTRQIVALLNVPPSKWRATDLMQARGYSVMSVIGNEAAKVALTPVQHYDLFLIGNAAPDETRQEMAFWLKAKYPRVKILALNSPNREVLRADYNVWQNGPEDWLPIVSTELANSADNPGPNKASTSGV